MQNLELDSRTADELISLLNSITVLNDNLARGAKPLAVSLCSSVLAAKARKLINELQEVEARENLHEFARVMDEEVGVQE